MTTLSARESYVKLLEDQGVLDGRFTDLKGLDPQGGHGNYSMVFSANDESTGAKVAVKFVSPDYLSDDYRLRCFRREAGLLEAFAGDNDILDLVQGVKNFSLILSAPSSPGISVPIEIPYFITPFADGDLDSFIMSPAATPHLLLAYFRRCCRAVQRLHTASVAHRDLKPGNFLRFGNELLKLSDFGTARRMVSDEPPLRSNYPHPRVRGDESYTAPELLFGEESRDRAFFIGDFYSLGAILFEMFTQKVLNHDILTRRLLYQLQTEAAAIPDEQLPKWTEQKIEELASHEILPSMNDLGARLPEEISVRLTRLYNSLAALDFRRRLTAFETVFTELDRCDDTMDRIQATHRLEEERRRLRGGNR